MSVKPQCRSKFTDHATFPMHRNCIENAIGLVFVGVGPINIVNGNVFFTYGTAINFDHAMFGF